MADLADEKLSLEITDLRRWWVKILLQGLIQGVAILGSVLIAVLGWQSQYRIDEGQRAQAEQFHEDEVLAADLDRLASANPTERASAAFALAPFALTSQSSLSKTPSGVLVIKALLEQLHFESQNRVANAISSAIETIGPNALPFLHDANANAAQSLTQAVARHVAVIVLEGFPSQKPPESAGNPLMAALLDKTPQTFSPGAERLKDSALGGAAAYIRDVAFSRAELVGPTGEFLDFTDIWNTTLSNAMQSAMRRAMGQLARESKAELRRTDKEALTQVDRRARELATLDSTIQDIVNRTGTLPNVDLSDTVLLDLTLNAGTYLPNADLRGSYVEGEAIAVRLPCADLSGSDLSYLDLSYADLRGATLSNAIGLRPNTSTILDGADWWDVKGDHSAWRQTRNLTNDEASRATLRQSACEGLVPIPMHT